MENTGPGLAGRHWLVNARILRDANTLAPTAVMLIYMKEMSLARMYSFFSDDICIVDEAGTILSASDASRIGSKGPDAGGAASRIRIYIPGLRADLVAEPDASLFNDVRANALAVCAILCAVCAVISLIYAVWISRGLTRPINALVETMQAAPSTGFRQKYGGSESDEIGYLGDAFNGMLDDIRRYVADIEAAQRRTRNSEVKFLQAQINPHLLYNTLDTVEYYVSRHENQIASDILHSLSGYFKSSLRQGRDFVPLSDEVENIRGYMELQRLCRGKDIKLELDIPPELMALPILRITLQPVVENAYLHAFLGTLDDGVIEIRAASAGGDDILIRVSDNGIGMDEAALQQTREAIAAENCEGRSFGLWNLNRRLKACYGAGYGIEVDSCFGEYTRVTIRVARREGGLECIG
jgi:sensor histidine kinase YesM